MEAGAGHRIRTSEKGRYGKELDAADRFEVALRAESDGFGSNSQCMETLIQKDREEARK